MHVYIHTHVCINVLTICIFIYSTSYFICTVQTSKSRLKYFLTKALNVPLNSNVSVFVQAYLQNQPAEKWSMNSLANHTHQN